MRENSESSVACHHRVGFLGLLVTLGIVFGDIGTSPLYVMKAILHTGETINESTILGALSCIIWTLTLQTTIKYVCVALRADNNGEGGILALYALLRKMKRKWIYLLAIIGASTLLADGIITLPPPQLLHHRRSLLSPVPALTARHAQPSHPVPTAASNYSATAPPSPSAPFQESHSS